MRRRIAILASGTGSNAENLAAYFQNSDVAEVALLIADREAPVIDRLKSYGVPAEIVPRAEWRENPQKAVAVMRDAAVDLVVLAGFLTVVPKEVLEAFPERIVNVHPSLLPKFGGKGMWGMNVHRAVIAAGETESGITIHYVSEGVDTGAAIAQFRCPVTPSDTSDTLAAKIHALEQVHLPEIIQKLVEKRMD